MKENIRETFSNNLKRYMLEKNITQQQLANFVGVSDAAVNNWVKGYKLPRMDKVDSICKFFNISRSDLIESLKKFNKKKISERLLYTISAKNISIKQLSETSLIDEISINNYISMKKEPIKEELQKMAEALDISYNYLTGNDEEERIKLLARKMGKLDENKFRQALKVIDAMIDNFEEEQARNGEVEK